MFGVPVKTMNRLQASGLIDRLLELHGKKNGNGKSGNHGGKYSSRRPTSTRP
jgi:hypothetical protein